MGFSPSYIARTVAGVLLATFLLGVAQSRGHIRESTALHWTLREVAPRPTISFEDLELLAFELASLNFLVPYRPHLQFEEVSRFYQWNAHRTYWTKVYLLEWESFVYEYDGKRKGNGLSGLILYTLYR
jgi:hypothetical protein